jgi:predicted regulator of Ras-like GTPase activity (Roadblock/LC7/MglB family)
VADEIRRWSDELARDPASLVFLQLGEALRRQGQLDLALRIAIRGLERHPHNADAHDLLARIEVARGALQHAFDEWDMVLRLAPGHLGALKGMAFVCFRQGRSDDAQRYLEHAAQQGGDEEVLAALTNMRRAGTPLRLRVPGDEPAPTVTPPVTATPPSENGTPRPAPPAATATPSNTHRVSAASMAGFGPNDPHALFADLLGDHEQTALLLDDQGLVLAGMYLGDDGVDVGAEVGAELSGVTDAARRATKHLAIGDWRAIVLETEVAVVTMAPSAGDGLLVLAASKATPLGLVRRVLDRCVERARRWLETGR